MGTPGVGETRPEIEPRGGPESVSLSVWNPASRRPSGKKCGPETGLPGGPQREPPGGPKATKYGPEIGPPGGPKLRSLGAPKFVPCY